VSVSTCGTSCAPCATGANAVATCNGVQCGLACTADHANCDGVATNGCEVDLETDGANCGACGTSCNGQPCVTGVCQAPPVPDAGPPVVDSSVPPVPDAGSAEDSATPPPEDAAAE
jgi:hypothetical protein